MIVNLIKSEKIFSISLPEKKKGRLWIKDIDFDERPRNLISIEAIENKWIARSNKIVSIIRTDGSVVNGAVIQPGSFLKLRIGRRLEEAVIYVEPENEGMKTFTRYLVAEKEVFTIGRSAQCEICAEKHEYVSGIHARLSYDNGSWHIEDLDSRNGTYVNGYRVKQQRLYPGDCIYILGIRIILGYQFFAINNPDGCVRVTSEIKQIEPQGITPVEHPDYGYEKKNYFYKSPRFKQEIQSEEISIDPPPAAEKNENVPIALLLGPSVTMGMASVATASISVINVINTNGDMIRALPAVIMAGSMILGAVFWPLLTKKSEKKKKLQKEKMRQKRYLKYLNDVKDNINSIAVEQAKILRDNAVTIDDCILRIKERDKRLWERTVYQNDFLNLRLGMGTIPLQVKVNYQRKKFTMEEDNLQDHMIALGKEKKELENVPVTLSFKTNFIAGIIGERILTKNFLKMLIVQMTALFGYDELKMIFITEESEEKEWEFMKIIPHIWNNEKTTRYFAANLDDVKELSAEMEKILTVRKAGGNIEDNLPYYMILCTSRESMDKCAAMDKLLEYKENAGFSILCIGEEINDIPSNAKSVISLEYENGKIFAKNDISGDGQSFVPDKINVNELEAISIELANIELDMEVSHFALPNMLTFLEMFGVSKIEHLNPLLRWKENSATLSLQTPVGVDTVGDLFMLDLHEKYHGPHGLVAGMTGSGKSEFIITYILSMAVNYHPDEVAFILIDYKGGGLADAFEDKERGIKLPHLAGTITNLDGASVKRSLVSIQSELKRRQSIFKEARRIAEEGTMDIYKYQQLYRNGILKTPVPHLFIISDEFAELKVQQPEFMEQLISTARIGRSLGVHLILATQKPSGVVNDQIWSNSKFRVCLKVQEKADSQEMIKCPDAAEISQTGRFYLQVGFNELFALGQSAWCGAEYIPTEDLEKNSDASIQIISNLGRIIRSVKPDKRVPAGQKAGKQVVEIVKYISALAGEEGIGVKPLWLPPIPDKIYIGQLEDKYGVEKGILNINPIVGEYDNPFEQQQQVLTVPFSKEGNCIVYGAAGNGKTTFLTTLVYSILRHYTSEEINLYLMDFASETLKVFEHAPQIGGVAFASEEEKVINLFRLISAEIQNRKKLFSDFGGDFAGYCKNSGKTLPNLIVMINNYAVFNDEYPQLAEQLIMISRECAKYGIYFVLTATTMNVISYRVAQNFKQIYTMQMNDPLDYLSVMGKTEGLVPMKYKGRGLVKLGEVYEFQTAYCTEKADTQKYLRKFCTQLSEKKMQAAKSIPVLPETVVADTVIDKVQDMDFLPYGIGKNSLAVMGMKLKDKCIYPISSYSEKALKGFSAEFIKILKASGILFEVWDAYGFLKAQEEKGYTYINQSFAESVGNCYNDLLEKNHVYTDAQKNADVLEKYPSKIYLVLGMRRIFSYLDESKKVQLTQLLENDNVVYRTKFIIVDTCDQYREYQASLWYQTQLNGTAGLWIGDGITDQNLFKIGKLSSSLRESIGNRYGYAVVKTRPVLIKVVTDDDGRED